MSEPLGWLSGWGLESLEGSLTGGGGDMNSRAPQAYLSLWFPTWSLQCGSFWEAGLLTWWLRAAKVCVLRRETQWGSSSPFLSSSSESLSITSTCNIIVSSEMLHRNVKELQICVKTTSGKE